MENNNIGVPNNLEKKSKVFNIAIIVLIVALAVIFVASKVGKKSDTDIVAPDESSETVGTESQNTSTNTSVSVPEPVGEWTSGSIKNEITFDVPPTYYVSYPVIGDCDNVVSISTQTSGAPTLPIALIYKDGCVTDTVVTGKYTHREVKNGYVFQTNSNNASVVSLYNRIVASAK